MTNEHGPWVKGIWTDWIDAKGIKLPKVTPQEKSAFQRTTRKVYSKEKINDLKQSFSSTIRDYVSEFGKLPIWASTFIDRSQYNILTRSRSKKFTGYIINRSKQDSAYRDKIFEVFKQGGFILNLNDVANKKLLSQDIRFIEKELVTIKYDSFLVYRFLNNKADLQKVTTIHWNTVDSGAKELHIQKKDKNKEWRVLKRTNMEFDEINSDELDHRILMM